MLFIPTRPTLEVCQSLPFYCLPLDLSFHVRQPHRELNSVYLRANTNMPHAHADIEMADPITIADVKEIAKKRLDPAAWEYYITGADDEQSVRRNETIFKK